MTAANLIGKIVMGGRKIERVFEDEKSGWWCATLIALDGKTTTHERSQIKEVLISKLERLLEPRDMRWILSALKILNISELSRLSEVPRHKFADAERGKAKFTDQECVAIRKIIDQHLK